MSKKTSTAALDSLRHESFFTRRRAPRHPAGEAKRSTGRVVFRPSERIVIPSEARDLLFAQHPAADSGRIAKMKLH